MAIIKDSDNVNNLRGRVGKHFIFKQYAGQIVVSKIPDMSQVIYNEKQLAERSRFQEAVAYAKSIINDPEKKAAYQAKLEIGKKVYSAAIFRIYEKKYLTGWKL